MHLRGLSGTICNLAVSPDFSDFAVASIDLPDRLVSVTACGGEIGTSFVGIPGWVSMLHASQSS